MTGTLYLVRRTGGKAPHPLREWLRYPIRRKDTAQTSFLSCNVSNKAPCSTKSSGGARTNRVTSRKEKKSFRRNRVIVGHTYTEMRRRLIYFRGMGGREEGKQSRERDGEGTGGSVAGVRTSYEYTYTIVCTTRHSWLQELGSREGDDDGQETQSRRRRDDFSSPPPPPRM